MPGNLLDPPSEIAAVLLIDLGLGTDPEDDPSGEWPVYASQEVDLPDDCLMTFDTAGRSAGRSMIDGDLLGHAGFQVRVRSTDVPTGWAKANEIRNGLAKNVLNARVRVGANEYAVQAVSGIGDVLAPGKEEESERSIFTVNALLAVRLV